MSSKISKEKGFERSWRIDQRHEKAAEALGHGDVDPRSHKGVAGVGQNPITITITNAQHWC